MNDVIFKNCHEKGKTDIVIVYFHDEKYFTPSVIWSEREKQVSGGGGIEAWQWSTFALTSTLNTFLWLGQTIKIVDKIYLVIMRTLWFVVSVSKRGDQELELRDQILSDQVILWWILKVVKTKNHSTELIYSGINQAGAIIIVQRTVKDIIRSNNLFISVPLLSTFV